MRISDWSSDVCSSDLDHAVAHLDIFRDKRQGTATKLGKLVDPDDERRSMFPAAHALPGEVQGGSTSRTRVVDVKDRNAADPHLLDDALACKHSAESMADRTSTRLNSSHYCASRIPASY